MGKSAQEKDLKGTTRDDDWPRQQRGNPIDLGWDSGQDRFLVGVVRIQSDQPWADGLMQRSLLGCQWGNARAQLDRDFGETVLIPDSCTAHSLLLDTRIAKLREVRSARCEVRSRDRSR